MVTFSASSSRPLTNTSPPRSNTEIDFRLAPGHGPSTQSPSVYREPGAVRLAQNQIALRGQKTIRLPVQCMSRMGTTVQVGECSIALADDEQL